MTDDDTERQTACSCDDCQEFLVELERIKEELAPPTIDEDWSSQDPAEDDFLAELERLKDSDYSLTHSEGRETQIQDDIDLVIDDEQHRAFMAELMRTIRGEEDLISTRCRETVDWIKEGF